MHTSRPSVGGPERPDDSAGVTAGPPGSRAALVPTTPLPPQAIEGDDDDGDADSGPIARAIGASINAQHIDRGLAVVEKLVDAFSQRGHKQSMARVVLNYGALVAVAVILAWLNLAGTMPAEALTGFLGTGIGYWLATSRQP